tara:strand:- start:18 stop:491 length:474 start_codon:yes stop_codon:yes gene_type:complete
MTKAADLALGKIAALKTALIEFTDGDDAIAVADAGVVTLLTTAVAKSEGGAVTTNIAQGLLKVWFYKQADGTSYGDSFNSSSLTDTGTGDFTVVFNNNLANSTFGAGTVSTTAHASQPNSSGVQGVDFNSGHSRFRAYQNGGLTDVIVNGNFAGDLA